MPIKDRAKIMINRGNPVRNIGKNPDIKTINEVPKSGCWKIKKETNKIATREMNQSEYFGFNSFLVKKAATDSGKIRRMTSEGWKINKPKSIHLFVTWLSSGQINT